MRFRALLILTAAVGLSAAAADWPQWRGPGRDGKSPDTNLLQQWPKDGPKLLWAVKDVEKIGTGYGSPAVVGDRLYLHGGTAAKGAKEFCTCLNVADGSVVWKTPLETASAEFLEKWGGGPRDTPTVDGDSLYLLGAAGDLYCLNTADGKVVWKKNLVADFGGKVPGWGYSESPLVDGDKVVVTPGSKGGIIALNKKTGELVWQCKELTDDAGYSSLVTAEVGGVRLYVQQTMKASLGVRADDGKLLWRLDQLKRRVAVIPTPVVKGDQVLFTAGYNAGGELVKMSPDGSGGVKAEQVYQTNDITNHHGGVVLVGDHIYCHSDVGNWECVEFATGEVAWSSTKLKGKGSITYADGHLYCLNEQGTIALIRASPNDWTETGRFTLPELSPIRSKTDGKVWPHPVVANGKLYLRDYEYLYCYDVSQSQK